MTHFSKISTKAFLAAAGLVVSGPVLALGLGDAEVDSYLNQPLKARIDLLSSDNDDLASVTAGLASAADYELIGASMESVSVPLSFSIEDVDGDAYILATSDLPMTSPIVRLIVEVDWSSGRMLREYTLFLDPASIASTAPAPKVSAPVARAPEVSDAVETPAPTSAQPASIASDEEYGPVQGGETLWGIATNWSAGSGLDVNKVMLAIQQENPQAFMRNNINLLKRGAILRMPEITQIQGYSTAAAMAEVSSQSDEFKQRVSEGTVTSASTPLLAEDSPADSAETPSEPDLDLSLTQDSESTDSRDQLELVPPSEASELDSVYGFEENPEGAELTASGSVTSLRENLARTEEDLINEQQQNEYLQQQLEELEARLAEQEQAANAKAAELAAMEQRLKREREAEQNKAWYSGLLGWLVAIGVLIAALIGWLFSRRGRAEDQASADASEEALRDIQDEAEEVLKVLDDEEDAASTDDESESAAGDGQEAPLPVVAVDADSEADPGDESSKPSSKVKSDFSGHVDDAELLDEDSSDPEIQLDLARAYISMGDKEAARVILDEVLTHGNEEQQADAQSMKDKL